MIDYSFEQLSVEIEDAIARLFPDDAQEKSPARLRWRFRDNPHGAGWFAVARNSGRIVGMIGLSATRICSGSEAVAAYQVVDVIVDPESRGQGLFKGLGRTVLEGAAAVGARMVWGFPNDQAAPGWFGRFGWLRFGTAPFIVRPLRSGYFLGRLAPPLARLDVPLARAPRGSLAAIDEVERFTESFNKLAAGERYPCSVGRDAAMLNWRLCDRPDSHYRKVALLGADGEPAALVVSCVLNKHDGRIFYVMEALAAPGAEASLVRLLGHEICRAAAAGADAALAWCPRGAANRAAYRRSGFLFLPDRLRPITIHFGAKPLSDDLPAAVLEGKNWYLSYLDSDTV